MEHKKSIIPLGTWAMAVGLILSGCSATQETDTLQGRGEDTETTQEAADLEIERAETRMELIALRDRIDARISDVENHLGMVELEDQQRNELQQYRDELVRNRQRVEQELSTVEAAEAGTWENIRTNAENTAQDVGDWFERQSGTVESWFQDNDTVPGEQQDTIDGP